MNFILGWWVACVVFVVCSLLGVPPWIPAAVGSAIIFLVTLGVFFGRAAASEDVVRLEREIEYDEASEAPSPEQAAMN